MTWALLMTTLVAAALRARSTDEGEFERVDVARLATMTHGTELIVLENAYHGEERKYRFEDFFWTGSGDGTDEDDSSNTEKPSTVYKTRTVVSTVYLEAASTPDNQNSTRCTHNCEGPSVPVGEIAPTATYDPQTYNGTYDEGGFSEADRQFWLLTVLKSDGKDPVIVDLKKSLARLYKTAFERQQERHLGINRTKRAVPEDPVNVYIHDISKVPSDGDEKIEVLYHVSVAGKPIPAVTAAEDMTLVSDEEVRNALGYPFIVKAEPYLKPAAPEGLSRARNTWIFIGTSLLVLFVVLLLIAFLTLGFTKRKPGVDNRKQVFDEEGPGFEDKCGARKGESPTYINFRHQPSNQTIKSGILLDRPKSSSSSSTMSLDISPLMGLKTTQRTPPRKLIRPKAALNKTAPLLPDSPSSASTQDTSVLGDQEAGITSPKSYLSMPSVRSFPRTNMPEPLAKVLEPVSVLHLDQMDDEEYRGLKRHGSLGTMEDPGVIGPVVWNMHQHRLQHGLSYDEGIELPSSVARMRRRFNDLLDDTFSLFGSRRTSPTRREQQRPRPKTCDSRRVVGSPCSEPPRGAWTSTTPSPLVLSGRTGDVEEDGRRRPVTAPMVRAAHVLAEGRLRPDDPAVPLIAAIKTELEKCSLPGSTSELRM